MHEWTRYRAEVPSAAGQSSNGAELKKVRHVAHTALARRILEDGFLRSSIVRDESRLNKSRISVTWLSANTWANGSLYGNIEFSFLWDKIAQDRKFYWVEIITAYKPSAFRVLITDRDLNNLPYVTPYDPSSNEGPLRQKNGIWYWNSTLTSEFLIDGDIDLSDCCDFEFIRHHDSYCSLTENCEDFRTSPESAGGMTISFLLANSLHCVDHVLKKPPSYATDRKLSRAFDTGITGIWRLLTKSPFGGKVKNGSSSEAILRGALALYAYGNRDEARSLVSLLSSETVLETALVQIVESHFGISGWELGP